MSAKKVKLLGLPRASLFSSTEAFQKLVGKLFTLAASQKKKTQVLLVSQEKESYDGGPADYMYALSRVVGDSVQVIPLPSESNFLIYTNASYGQYWFHAENGIPYNASVQFDDESREYSLLSSPRTAFTASSLTDTSLLLQGTLVIDSSYSFLSSVFPPRMATAYALASASFEEGGFTTSIVVRFDQNIPMPSIVGADTTQPTFVEVMHFRTDITRDPETQIEQSRTTTYIGRIVAGAGATGAYGVAPIDPYSSSLTNTTDIRPIPGKFHADTLVRFSVTRDTPIPDTITADSLGILLGTDSNSQSFSIQVPIATAAQPSFSYAVDGMTLTFTNESWVPGLENLTSGTISYAVTGDDTAQALIDASAGSIDQVLGNGDFFTNGQLSAEFFNNAPGVLEGSYTKSVYKLVVGADGIVTTTDGVTTVTVFVNVNYTEPVISGAIVPLSYRTYGDGSIDQYTIYKSDGSTIVVTDTAPRVLYSLASVLNATLLSSQSLSQAVTGATPQVMQTAVQSLNAVQQIYSAHPDAVAYLAATSPVPYTQISLDQGRTVYVTTGWYRKVTTDDTGKGSIEAYMIPYMNHRNVIEGFLKGTLPPPVAGWIRVDTSGNVSVVSSDRYDAEDTGDNQKYNYTYPYKSVFRDVTLPTGYRQLAIIPTTSTFGWGRFSNPIYVQKSQEQSVFKGEAGQEATGFPSPFSFVPPTQYGFSYYDVLRDISVFIGTIGVDGLAEFKFDIGGRVFTRTCLSPFYVPPSNLPLVPKTVAPAETNNVGFASITVERDSPIFGGSIYASFESLSTSYLFTTPSNNLYPLLSVTLYLPSNKLLFWSWTPKANIEKDLLVALMSCVSYPLNSFADAPALTWPASAAAWVQYSGEHAAKLSEVLAEDITDAAKAFRMQEFSLAQLETAIEPLYKTSGAGDIDLRYLVGGIVNPSGGSVENFSSVIYVRFDEGDNEVDSTDLLQQS